MLHFNIACRFKPLYAYIAKGLFRRFKFYSVTFHIRNDDIDISRLKIKFRSDK